MSHVYSFLGYGYAVHAKLGVKASDDTHDHFHKPQEHEAQQFAAYEALERLVSEPDAFDEPSTQQAFISAMPNVNCTACVT